MIVDRRAPVFSIHVRIITVLSGNCKFMKNINEDSEGAGIKFTYTYTRVSV